MTDAMLELPALSVDRRRPVTVAEGTRARWWTTTHALLLGDLVAASAAAILATQTGRLGLATTTAAVLVACWGGCLAASRAAEASSVESRRGVCQRVGRAACSLAFVGTALSLVRADLLTAADAFAIAALWGATSCGLRLVLPLLATDAGRSAAPLLVTGDGDQGRQAVAALGQRLGGDVPVVQVASGDERAREAGMTVRDVADHARRTGARAVVAVPGSGIDAPSVRRLQWELEGSRIPFYVDPGVLGVVPTRLLPSDVGGLALIRVRAVQRRGGSWAAIGACGRVLAALGLAVLLPALVVIGIAIRRTSPGPAIYRQVRVGQDGRPFTIFKFRTMVADGAAPKKIENELDGVLFKMRADPRVTPLGRWLRRYSLDELPQLANVVLGQMRLVGPRPALPDEVSAYESDVRRRLAVKPGITGLWQVSGRSDLTWEETVRLDLHYVDNWSPWLDLAILGRTLSAVLGHRGAY